MMTLRWRIRGQSRETFAPWRSLLANRELSAVLGGPVGSAGLAAPARDLIRIGLAVHAIERSLPAALSTNRPVEFDVQIALEEPAIWDKAAVAALAALLSFQGDATWHWTMQAGAGSMSGLGVATVQHDPRSIDYVTLFSGGLDSTCGIALASEDADRTQLVSHYSKQKSRQLAIAEELGYRLPTQFRIDGIIGRGRGFFYRSFYFLCLAAAVASSYGANRIVQYENGVLATAVPPSPAYFMTRHAHPRVHQSAETLFSAVLGGRWKIDNPFLYRTKGETVNELLARLGDVRARKIIAETETCWYQYSNQLAANRGKPPGKPCGVCVPCIIRRAALDKSEGHYDLNRRKVRGDAVLARDFNAYQTLVARVKAPNGGARTFLEFPGYVKDLTKGAEPVFSRDELIALFHRFATEFENAFSLSRVR